MHKKGVVVGTYAIIRIKNIKWSKPKSEKVGYMEIYALAKSTWEKYWENRRRHDFYSRNINEKRKNIGGFWGVYKSRYAGSTTTYYLGGIQHPVWRNCKDKSIVALLSASGGKGNFGRWTPYPLPRENHALHSV